MKVTYTYNPANLVTLISVVLAMIVAYYTFRFQRGVFGVLLAIFVAGLGIYWARELYKEIAWRRNAVPGETFSYELIANPHGATLVAKIGRHPGSLEVLSDGGHLKVLSGRRTLKKIRLPFSFNVANHSYVNGVLRVDLTKTDSST